jgi:pimeloyl-ACP methyl ester carboxylesterase
LEKVKLDHKKTREYDFSYIYHKGNSPLTLIMLHGHGASNEYLRPILDYPKLAEYSILIPDLVGFGDTPAPAGFSFRMEDQAKAVKQLIDVLGVEDKIVLLGSSMGGAIAVMLAEMLDGKVKGFINAEGTIDINDCSAPNQAIAAQPYEFYEKTVFWKRLEELRADPDYVWVVRSQEKAGPVSCYKSIVDYVRVAREDTLTVRLANLGVPVLAIFGEKNRGLRTMEERFRAIEGAGVVYIPRGGHVMMRDNPDAYYQAIEEFMNQISKNTQ